MTAPLNQVARRADDNDVDPAADAFAAGIRSTRETLNAWNQRPGPVVARWLLGAFAAAVVLLVAVLVIAAIGGGGGQAQIDRPPFVTGDITDVSRILASNLLVLALHAFACVAGFIAGSQLPLQADAHTGWRRSVHLRGGRFAIAFVVAATVFSLTFQALTIGTAAARVAQALHTSPPLLLLALLPHALPELTALFLPLSAWILASRRGEWDQLLAATAVTVALAMPMLLVCACWEVFGAPHLVHALIG